MVGVTRDLCESIIEQYEPAEEARKNGYMTVDGRECRLFSKT